jgi:hypothetical protein
MNNGFVGIGTFEKRNKIDKPISQLKKERTEKRLETVKKHGKETAKTFNSFASGINSFKKKRVKKSFNSEGLKL